MNKLMIKQIFSELLSDLLLYCYLFGKDFYTTLSALDAAGCQK